MMLPGLNSFTQWKELIEAGNSNTSKEVSKVNGLITITAGSNEEILFTDGLLTMLGLDNGLEGQWLNAGTFVGDCPVNLTSTKMFYLYLEQINRTENIVDGSRSTLLAMVGWGCFSFGDIGTIRDERPEFKCLQCGTVDELQVINGDDAGKIIENLA